jgi:hypothetical protein
LIAGTGGFGMTWLRIDCRTPYKYRGGADR